MFERFTPQARQLVVSAQQEARRLQHRYIGTEHLLLALLDPGSGIPYSVLLDAGVTHENVVADLGRFVANAPGALSEADAAALEAIGIDLDAVRAKLEETFGPGALSPEPEPPRGWLARRRMRRRRMRARKGSDCGGYLPFTPRAKKVLELSLREALALKHGYIGTEHMLLGLVREGEGLAARLLTVRGARLEDLRQRTITALRPAA
jgi:ATP-dependent Clp protease ATP-binding subunit ClpA